MIVGLYESMSVSNYTALIFNTIMD